MILYTSTVMLLIGVAGIFSNYYNNFVYEIFLGLLPHVMIGYWMVLLIKKHLAIDKINFNKILVRFYWIKFIFFGSFILTIFIVYSFNPIPFMCSFTASFIVINSVEVLILSKSQVK